MEIPGSWNLQATVLECEPAAKRAGGTPVRIETILQFTPSGRAATMPDCPALPAHSHRGAQMSTAFGKIKTRLAAGVGSPVAVGAAAPYSVFWAGPTPRSARRRVGKASVHLCSARWAPYPSKKKK